MEMVPARPSQRGPELDFLQLALDLGGSLDARTVVGRVLTTGVQLARADRATLSSVDADHVTIEASVGTRSGDVSWAGHSYSLEGALATQPLIRRMFESSSVTFGGPFEVTGREELNPALREVRHSAVVPIVDDGGVAGMLVISRYRDAPFEDPDRPMLAAFGSLAGLALRNARLYEQAGARARRLHSAIQAAVEIGTEPAIEALLSRLVSHAAEAAGASSASLLRIEGEEAVTEVTSGVAPPGSRWPLSEEVQARLREGGHVELSRAGFTVDGPLAELAARYSHALLVPLRLAGEMEGVLVAGRAEAQPFTTEDVEGLQQFSSLAALLMSNHRLLARVAAAERAKSEFVDIAVHELRSPLTVIGGYAALIEQGAFGDVPSALATAASTIGRKSEEARDLADSLLAMARLESGSIRLGAEPISVSEVVDDVLRRGSALLALSEGMVECALDGQPTALADWSMTARVLDILVGNAVAYSESPPRVAVSARTTGDMVEIRVTDSGDGVPSEETERIFERFVRGSRATERGNSGSGLGLYVSREAARQMGGDLTLERTLVGGGSTFLLRLPAG